LQWAVDAKDGLVLVGHLNGPPARHQVEGAHLSDDLFVYGKRQFQIGDVTVVVFDEGETLVEIRIQRRQLVERTEPTAEQTRQKGRRERHVHHDTLHHGTT
jgi:hypothetical protein